MTAVASADAVRRPLSEDEQDLARKLRQRVAIWQEPKILTDEDAKGRLVGLYAQTSLQAEQVHDRLQRALAMYDLLESYAIQHLGTYTPAKASHDTFGYGWTILGELLSEVQEADERDYYRLLTAEQNEDEE